MQKVIIDTNVIVSSLIQNSYPYLIIYELFVEEKFDFCVSEKLMAEYYEVLARPKFGKYQNFFIRAEALLTDIETSAIKYTPTIKIELISDKDDNKMLELADECEADFIVTGNTNDFTFPTYRQTKNCNTKRILGKISPLIQEARMYSMHFM